MTVYFQVVQYLSYPVNIAINISFVDRLVFPTLTICSYNRLKKSKVATDHQNSSNMTEILNGIPVGEDIAWYNRSAAEVFFTSLAHDLNHLLLEVHVLRNFIYFIIEVRPSNILTDQIFESVSSTEGFDLWFLFYYKCVNLHLSNICQLKGSIPMHMHHISFTKMATF